MAPKQYTKQHVVELLHRLGHTEAAEDAQKVLPDLIDANQLAEWALHHGISHDNLISRMGGSP
jgi:hypothetical protein